MSELTSLKVKRGSLKSQLTLFGKYLVKLDKVVDETKLTNLEERLDKIFPLFDKYTDIQNEIDCLLPDDEDELNEREEFQDKYFDLVSRANQIRKNNRIQDDNQSLLGSERSSKISRASEHSLESMNLILPTINLPVFDGTFTHWREFCDAFTSLIHLNTNIPDGRKLNYLKSSLKGEPADLLRPLEITDENYTVAWDKLKKKYDNKRKIIYNHVRAVLEIAPVVKESVQGLQKFVNTVETHIECLKTWEQPVESWDALLVPILLAKLDNYTNKEWESKINKGNSKREHIPTFNDFLEFLNDKVNTLDAIYTKRADAPKALVTPNKNQASKSFATLDISCIVCNGDHVINNCEVFTKLTSQERNTKARDLKLCINCLRKGHFVQNCKSLHRCKTCSNKHHTLLHNSDPKSSQLSSSKPEESNEKKETTSLHVTANYAANISNNKHVVLSTAKINVYDNKKNRHELRVLLDSASQSHFITESVCNLLQLKKEKINMSVMGITEGSLDIKYQVHLNMQSRHNNFKETITCLVVPKITDKLPAHFLDVKNFYIPPNIKLADPNFHQPDSVDLIIGASLFWDLLCVGQVKIPNSPTLQKTKLGWIIAGNINQVNEAQSIRTTFLTMDSLQREVERFWKMDEFVQKQQMFTPEEEYAMDLFERTTTRNEEGRFIVRMSLKQNINELGNSFEIAKSRFNSLERRFRNNEEFKRLYIKCMEDYMNQGHISKAKENEENSFYLPHHAVIKESSKTTKLRIVFDGSCHLNEGLSINQVQNVGPILQDDLFNIITRFRTHQYVLTGDITQMYRQIIIHPAERKYQKIVWRNNEDEPFESYEINRVTFGMTSAPFLAIRCQMQLAREYETKYPVESEIIKTDFYVDDMITGCNDVDDLKTIKSNIQEILRSGGFSLCKFNSNVLELREENRATEGTFHISDETFKTLGIQWNPNKDLFSYTNEETPKVNIISKRTILARTAKLFDPLGLIAPVIIIAKILLQDLWQAKLEWDESISLNLYTRWFNFEDDLKWLKEIKIRRLVIVPNTTRIELHTFADASEKAYGTRIYLRSINEDKMEINLLAAKSRVAPLKVITLPRLELCAAVIAAQLASKFKTILKNVKIDQEFFWTDSQITLAWIKAQPNKYKTFVANRISEIQQLTNPNDWYHVRTQHNPADLITRGVSPKCLIKMNLWWHGPPWLKNESSSWQLQSQEIITDPPEEKTTIKTFLAAEETIWFPIEKYSLFVKAQRVMAYCLRFITNLKSKSTQLTGELTVNEISNACTQLVKIVQNQEFGPEIKDLQKGNTLHRKSKLLNLAPFLDQSGILRVGGRLTLSNYPYDKKHPILLPKSNYLNDIIFQHEHIKLMHVGPNQLLAAIRDKFWPISGKNTAKKTVRQCIKCKRLKGEVSQQIMGQLPIQRTAVTYPFHTTGIDYAGPFILKDREGRGYKTFKAYICLFVCFSTKAIHLELVSELTTKAFIATLRRFIARRGKPLHIFSDNGTNFVGAINELENLKDFLTEENTRIHAHLSSDNINWHLIPPHSPNFGGLWEAGVKATKKHLKRVLGTTPLTYENFSTILVQIESILNSRPLTPLTTDPNDFIALTPAHFLIGRPLTAMPDPDVREMKMCRLDKFQNLQLIIRNFWEQWKKEYVNQLQVRAKWTKKGDPIRVNDLVIIKEDKMPPANWKLGRITELHPGQDGMTRVVTIKCHNNFIKRPVNKICVLIPSE